MAHAVDVGGVLARLAGAEVAFVARMLIGAFRHHLPQPSPPLEFVEVGSPLAEIVNAAKDCPADLIVIGSHGRGGVRRALLGSAAEGVMRQAPCSVLGVRAKA